MRKAKILLALILMGMLPLLLSCGGGGGGGDGGDGGGVTVYKTADYYPLAQGDTWTYQGPYTQTQVPGFLNKAVSGTETIDSVIATKVLIEFGGDYELWTVDSNGITYYKDYHNPPSGWSQEVYDPPLNYLPAEVSIGTIKSHNFRVYFTDSTGASEMAQLSGETTVVALEDVTVPAGTFTDCLKTETTHTLISSTIPEITYNVKTTLWVAKAVGVVKRVDNQNDVITETEKLHHATVGGINYPH